MNQKLVDKRLFNEVCFGVPDTERINELLKAGANINVIIDGESVLSGFLFFNSDCNDSIRILKFLLQNGANPNLDITDGFNCLYEACLKKEPNIVAVLLEAGTNCNCVEDVTGESLLDWALGEAFFLSTIIVSEEYEENHRKIVELLKQYNAKSSVDLN